MSHFFHKFKLSIKQDEDEGADDDDVGDDGGSEDGSTFSMYDANNDGEIDSEELGKYLVTVDDEATEDDVEVWNIYHLLLLQDF